MSQPYDSPSRITKRVAISQSPASIALRAAMDQQSGEEDDKEASHKPSSTSLLGSPTRSPRNTTELGSSPQSLGLRNAAAASSAAADACKIAADALDADDEIAGSDPSDSSMGGAYELPSKSSFVAKFIEDPKLFAALSVGAIRDGAYAPPGYDLNRFVEEIMSTKAGIEELGLAGDDPDTDKKVAALLSKVGATFDVCSWSYIFNKTPTEAALRTTITLPIIITLVPGTILYIRSIDQLIRFVSTAACDGTCGTARAAKKNTKPCVACSTVCKGEIEGESANDFNVSNWKTDDVLSAILTANAKDFLYPEETPLFGKPKGTTAGVSCIISCIGIIFKSVKI
jgi:hypothetical protein